MQKEASSIRFPLSIACLTIALAIVVVLGTMREGAAAEEEETVRGLVRDEADEPVAGARVILFSCPDVGPGQVTSDMLDDPYSSGYDIHMAQTDEAGNFEIAGVVRNHVFVLVVQHSDYAPAALRNPFIKWSAERSDFASLQLFQGGTIRGTVQGCPNLSLEDAAVVVQGRVFEYGPQSVAPDGSFQFDNLAPASYRVTLYQGEAWRRMVRATVVSGQTSHVDFANLPGVTVSGHLTCRGQAVPGIRVITQSAVCGDDVAAENTDANGRYALAGIMPGEYLITASEYYWKKDAPDPSTYAKTCKFLTVGTEDVEANLEFYPGRIVGQVVAGATGKPVSEHLWVRALRVRTGPPAPDQCFVCDFDETGYLGGCGGYEKRFSPRVLGLRATHLLHDPTVGDEKCAGWTDDHGHLEIVNARPGTYILTFREPDNSVPSYITNIIVGPEGETKPIEVCLDSSGILNLKIIDQVTKCPIQRALVHLCAPNGVYLTSRVRRRLSPEELTARVAEGSHSEYKYEHICSDTEGSVRIENMHLGIYGVWVMAPGYGTRWVAPLIARQPAPGHLPTTIDLKPAGTLLLKADTGLLNAIWGPYVAYQIRDVQDRIVFPGGRFRPYFLYENGLTPLFHTDTDGHRREGHPVDVLVPGRYSIQWEIHCSSKSEPGYQRLEIRPAIYAGQAQFEIHEGSGNPSRYLRGPGTIRNPRRVGNCSTAVKVSKYSEALTRTYFGGVGI